ncbi:MAG: hypothetical protein ACTH5U_11445, partial [Pseudomonadales bacterium]
MTDSLSFSKLAGAALIGSIMTGSLLGCQPSTDTAASEEVTADHEGHDHSDHEGHDHGEHEGHDYEGHDHASAGTPYTCEPTATIGASYHNDDTPHTANLIIDGLDYDLVA